MIILKRQESILMSRHCVRWVSWKVTMTVSRKVNLNFGALYFTDKSIDLSVNETMLKLNNVALYAASFIETSVGQCNHRIQI
jgi:hypothetical protein